MMRVLHIEVSSLQQSLRQFGDALKATMEGSDPESFEGIGFESVSQLFNTLTPRRWEMVELVRGKEPMSVQALADILGRDYGDVQADLSALEEIGIVERDEASRVSVPWDEIDVRVPLAA